MRVSDFDYELPSSLIAQEPLPERDSSRLLVVKKDSGELFDMKFTDVPELLSRGDLLVLNDTRVIPARLIGKKETGAVVELLLVRRHGGNLWEVIAKPAKRLKVGSRLFFGEGGAEATVKDILADGRRILDFGSEDVRLLMEEKGMPPLPPYIKVPRHGRPFDFERYQTIYARVEGAIAAPTAGLHFTERIFRELEIRGIKKANVTLHVGAGTFKEVRSENVEDHVMEEEYFYVGSEALQLLRETRARGGRIIAVGTTSARVLESIELNGTSPIEGKTGLFIYPGHKWKNVDALITNFHLPRSTLIMLVSSFAGRELIMKAYRHAVDKRYRFYSYGDAMFVI